MFQYDMRRHQLKFTLHALHTASVTAEVEGSLSTAEASNARSCLRLRRLRRGLSERRNGWSTISTAMKSHKSTLAIHTITGTPNSVFTSVLAVGIRQFSRR